MCLCVGGGKAGQAVHCGLHCHAAAPSCCRPAAARRRRALARVPPAALPVARAGRARTWLARHHAPGKAQSPSVQFLCAPGCACERPSSGGPDCRQCVCTRTCGCGRVPRRALGAPLQAWDARGCLVARRHAGGGYGWLERAPRPMRKRRGWRRARGLTIGEKVKVVRCQGALGCGRAFGGAGAAGAEGGRERGERGP